MAREEPPRHGGNISFNSPRSALQTNVFKCSSHTVAKSLQLFSQMPVTAGGAYIYDGLFAPHFCVLFLHIKFPILPVKQVTWAGAEPLVITAADGALITTIACTWRTQPCAMSSFTPDISVQTKPWFLQMYLELIHRPSLPQCFSAWAFSIIK